jgi:hypothetical protein
MKASDAEKFRGKVGVGVLDLMTFVKHAIRPSLAFDPGLLSNERLIGREHNVGPLNLSMSKSFFDPAAFSHYPMETQRG